VDPAREKIIELAWITKKGRRIVHTVSYGELYIYGRFL
jgi:hypothetical protein